MLRAGCLARVRQRTVMASYSVRLRPYTFYARLPRGVTNVDLVKVLVQRFSKNELSGVQDFSGGRFEVVFKTKQAVERFLIDPVVEVGEEKFRFEYRGSRSKVVRVFQYPLEEPDEELRKILSQYGQVHGMQRETIPGFADFVSGTRRIRMDMVTPVPNLIKVLDRYVARFEYDGVVHQCVRCGGTGHYAAACTTPKCSRCDQYGHETCEAPCALCQGDHARSQCRVKSFAAAVAGTKPAGAEATEIEGQEGTSSAVSEPVAASDEAGSNADDAGRKEETSSVGGASIEAQKSEENAAPAADALEQTTRPEQTPAEPSAEPPAIVAPEAAPSLAAAVPPAVDGETASPSTPIPKQKKKGRKAKRKLFEEKKQQSRRGLLKAVESELESETESPLRRKRVVGSGTEPIENEDVEFSSAEEESGMESEENRK